MKKALVLVFLSLYLPTYPAANDNDVIYNTLPNVSAPIRPKSLHYESPIGEDYQNLPRTASLTRLQGNPKDKKIQLTVTNKTPHPIKVLVKNNGRQEDITLVESTISPKKNHVDQSLTSSILSSQFPLRIRIMHDGLKNILGAIPDKNPLLEKVQVSLDESEIEVYYDDNGQLIVASKKYEK